VLELSDALETRDLLHQRRCDALAHDNDECRIRDLLSRSDCVVVLDFSPRLARDTAQ
jgi:hypothetical protein